MSILKLLLGSALILLGIICNPLLIERFVSDGNVESLSYLTQILALQLLLIFYGIHLSTNNPIFGKVVVILFVPFLIVSIVNVVKLFQSTSGKEEGVRERIARQMLNRVISLETNKLAELSEETSEILYSIHQNFIPLSFTIPDDGMLDTAIGIDPIIRNIWTGKVYFEVSIARNDAAPQSIWRTEIELSASGDKEFIWQKVKIDLSKYSGKEIVLNFIKGYGREPPNKPKIIYDLLPTDFMFWRKPHVRPKKFENKLNVILISVDTLRADHLHFMGYRRETSPNMDKLARNGVFFTTTVSQAPWTIPSHFSIFTSTYPTVSQSNQPINMMRNRRWNSKLPTMASILQDGQYMTAAFTAGGFMAASLGFLKGFDSFNETNLYGRTDPFRSGKCASDVEPIFNKSIQWLDENKDRTFFLLIHTYEPHAPYCDDYFVRQEKVDPSLKDIAQYDGDIRLADFFIGKLTEKLNRLKLMDRTLLVITSDHGEDLTGKRFSKGVHGRGHGHSLYDDVLLVPLIFYNPQLFSKAKSIDYQVRLIDVLPTILEYLGYPEQPGFHGKSLKAMIEGQDQLSRAAYSEATTYGTERESIRADGFKYIYRISYGQLSNPDSQGLTLTPLNELYNLSADPEELANLASKQKSLIEKYQNLIRSTFPEKSLQNYESGLPEGFDASKDKDLIESLKSLGYIQ